MKLYTVLLIMAGTAAGCTNPALAPLHTERIAIVQLIDKTDIMLATPDTAGLFAFFDMDNHKLAAITVRTEVLSNVDYNPVYVATLPSCGYLSFNPDARKTEIGALKQKAAKDIELVNAQKAGLPRSSIYAPLIRETNRLAGTDATVKVIMAYTDCGDNTDVFSVYKPEDRRLLKEHPEKVRALFAQYGRPGNLHGVVIHIICQPNVDIENANFVLMSGFYKSLLEEAGAQVIIEANLIPNK